MDDFLGWFGWDDDDDFVGPRQAEPEPEPSLWSRFTSNVQGDFDRIGRAIDTGSLTEISDTGAARMDDLGIPTGSEIMETITTGAGGVVRNLTTSALGVSPLVLLALIGGAVFLYTKGTK